MNDSWLLTWTRQRPMGLAAGLARLSAVVVVVAVVVGVVAHAHHGPDGIRAAGVAAGVCWLSSSLALTSAALLRSSRQSLAAMFLGMIFRMGLPLAAGVYLGGRGGALAEAGVFGMIVIFYLATLVAETYLSLRLVARDNGALSAR